MPTVNVCRLSALGFVAAAILASGLSCSQKQQATQSQPAVSNWSDLQTELKRCHDMGVQAANDPKCQDAWNRSNAHFFGTDRSSKPK
jgi:conjugative transfer region protein TrbK